MGTSGTVEDGRVSPAMVMVLEVVENLAMEVSCVLFGGGARGSLGFLLCWSGKFNSLNFHL